MRRLPTALAVFTVLPTAVIALPVTSRLHPGPRPVAPVVRQISAHLAADGAELAAAGGQRFSLVGARWDAGTLRSGVRVEVRAHSRSGWSAWTAMEPTDVGADRGSTDATAVQRHIGGTDVADPVWVGAADGVQLRAVGPRGVRRPGHLSAVLVDPGRSSADASVGAPAVRGSVAEAAVSRPTIYSRAQWGADESIRLRACPDGPDYGSTVKIGFVHHTDTANGYASGDVPSIIRGIYAYHVQSNGWCDIGYNFLVDRFGRIWEGRYGGIDRPVIGAHTGGFNTNSFAASLIGTYDSLSPSSAMLGAIERLYAWKLGSNYRNPGGADYLTAGSFSGSKYAAGTVVRFNVISGHRDADYTGCPGNAAYNTLATIRQAARSLLGAGFVAPSVSPRSRKVGEAGGFTVSSGVLTGQPWKLTVTNSSGQTVNTLTGSASQTAPINVTWPGTDLTGALSLPGTYTLTLTGTNAAGTATALPWSTTVQIVPPVSLSAPPTTGYSTRVVLAGSATPGSSVVVHLQGVNDSAPTDTSLTAGQDGTFSTAYQAVQDTTWWATANGWDSPKGTTRIAPTASAPPWTSVGSTISVAGTALPGSQVTVQTRPLGGAFSTIGTPTAAADGSWSVPITADRDYQWVVSSNGLSTPVTTLRAVPPPTATAPATAGYGSAVSVTGNATVPTGVTLYTAHGTSPFVETASTTAATNGAYALQFPLTSDTKWYVATSYGASPQGVVQVAPTVANPPLTGIGSTVTGTATSLPGTQVALYTRPLGSHDWGTPVATPTTGADGIVTWTWKADRSQQWYARSRGLSAVGVTTIAAPAPTLAGPPSAVYRATVWISGTAPARSVVHIWMKRGSARTYGHVAGLTVDPTGHYRWPFALTGDAAYYALGPSGQSPTRHTQVAPALSAPGLVRAPHAVTVNGQTVPGRGVAVYVRRYGTTHWYLARTTTADSAGRFLWSFTLRYSVQVYARSGTVSGKGITIRAA